jgi:hypothetical protein
MADRADDGLLLRPRMDPSSQGNGTIVHRYLKMFGLAGGTLCTIWAISVSVRASRPGELLSVLTVVFKPGFQSVLVLANKVSRWTTSQIAIMRQI